MIATLLAALVIAAAVLINGHLTRRHAETPALRAEDAAREAAHHAREVAHLANIAAFDSQGDYKMSENWEPGDLLDTHLARIVPRVVVADMGHSTPCWITNYATCRGGYVTLRADGSGQKLHRLTYRALVGPIPDGFQLDHLCRVRACCNPAHLDPVTPRVNTLRGFGVTSANARKTHCIHGHEFTPENTATRQDGTRKCVTCRRQHRMAHYYRNQVPA